MAIEIALDKFLNMYFVAFSLSVLQVFLKLSFPLVRRSAMAVFEHMMLSFQHSPEAFHKVFNFFPVRVKVVN